MVFCKPFFLVIQHRYISWKFRKKYWILQKLVHLTCKFIIMAPVYKPINFLPVYARNCVTCQIVYFFKYSLKFREILKDVAKWYRNGCKISLKYFFHFGQDFMRWMRWHFPTDTGFQIWALAVWCRSRYLLGTEAPHNIKSLRVSEEETFYFFETWRPEWGSTPRSPTFQAGNFNHCIRAPARTRWLCVDMTVADMTVVVLTLTVPVPTLVVRIWRL